MSERLGIASPFLALGSLSGSWPRASTLLIVLETLALVAGWGVAAAATRELLRARRRLEAVARAEHELRAPAAVLLLACERMRREPSGRRHAHALELELERMGRGLTALTAARTGRRPPPAGRGGDGRDLRTFVDGALAGWSPSLHAAGRPTRFRWDAGRVGLPAQRGALASALGNLVANAAEHGSGPVEVSGSRVPGAVRVEVRNADARRSQRLGAESSDERGRGLTIADEAAREAGGTLSIERGEADFTAALELPFDVAETFESWFGGRPRDQSVRRP
ncbi:MAG TPA: hypothetical protein VI111_03035 [Thermoleophilaceae bacterium]